MAKRLLFEHLSNNNEDLASELTRICEDAAKIWAEQHLREYTVHGGPHSDQVEANLDSLTAHLQQTNEKLSSEEIFVLIAACHLHDIGMQLGVPDARQKHAEYAYDLILKSWVWIDTSERRVTLSIHDQNARVAIAKVARGHWTDFALQLPEADFLYGQARGRLKLLGVLLATADLLDTSAIRAGYFRGDHRLFDLPPLSELHQALHSLVVGYQIKPANPHVPDKLVFDLEWRDQTELVQEMSEWQLRWFSSQIRQTASELEKLSGGAIRWTTPWAQVTFRVPEGQMPKLSDAALRILRADLAAQRRIARDTFVDQFQHALKTPSTVLFVLPPDSTSDVKFVAEWCLAHVRSSADFLTAQVDVPSDVPMEIASIVASILEQWGQHLTVSDNKGALRKLTEFVEVSKDRNLVLLAKASETSTMLPILEVVLTDKIGGGTRVVLLIAPGDGPTVSSAKVSMVDLSTFTPDDVGRHLGKRYGYNPVDQGAMVSRMDHLGLLTSPGRVYTYIEEHCDRDSWQNRIEEIPPAKDMVVAAT